MAATFNVSIVSATDRMRLDIGDIDVAAALWQDETYVGTLARYDSDESRATLSIVESSLIRFAGEPNKVEVVGAVKVEWTERLKFWAALVNRLRAELGLVPLGTADNTMRIGYLVRSTDTATEFGG